MGLISLPIMLRYGYDRRFASGVIAASGTLAQIIPPSLVLIIMADQLGKSVGDMYAGAFIPGITLAGLYAVYTIGVTLVKPAWAPALPPEARRLKEPDGSAGVASAAALPNAILKMGLLSRRAEQVIFVLSPPLALIFLVLGTIFLGWATPTEGGAMGASGALVMALARPRLSLKLLRQAMESTAKLSTFVVFILIG